MNLEIIRNNAAVASGGISSDTIYSHIESLITNSRLSGTVLEYGAGIGNLTKRLSSLEYFDKIIAADLISRPKDIPMDIEWLKVDLNCPLNIIDSSIDVIVCSEVIEHLENPRSIFREFHRLLKYSGKLILSTPNQESLRSLLALTVRGHFVDFSDSCYPAHITALLKKDMERICHEIGFNSIEFSYSNSGSIPKLPKYRWQDISFRLLRGKRFSDNIFLTAIK